MNEFIEFIKKNSLFHNINLNLRENLNAIQQVVIKEYSKNEIIYSPGEKAQYIYFVLQGEIGIFSIQNHQPFSIHKQGSFFGEVSLLSGESHSSRSIALTSSKLGLLPGNAFLELLNLNSEFAVDFLKILSSRFRENLNKKNQITSGRIFGCMYPEIPERNFFMIQLFGEITKREIHGKVLVMYFKPELSSEEKNTSTEFQKFYEHYQTLPPEYNFPSLTIWNCSLLLKQGWEEKKLTDFFTFLKKIFSVIYIEIPGFDFPISNFLLNVCDNLLFLQRFKATSFSIKSLYNEKFKELKIENKTIDVVELKPKENWNFTEENKSKFFIRTLMEENLPPIEHKTFRRMIRILLNRSRGLALAGGGARSLSHIGCLEIFEKENIEFDAVVGSSMGAVIGALYCMGKSSIEIRKMVDEFIPDSRTILDKNIPTISFFKGKKINVLLDEVFKDIRIEELDIPFYTIATDLVSGKMIVFDKGFLDFALRCSTSLPGIFPPIRFGELILVDGSVIANLPGHILKEKGYHKILGIDVTPIIDKISFGNELFSKRGVKGIYEYFSLPPILSIISRSITIQGRELTQYHTQFFDYVLHIDVSKFHLFDFDKKDEIIEIGNSTTLSKIGEIKQRMFDL